MEARVRPEGSAEAVLGSKKRIRRGVIASSGLVVELRLETCWNGLVVDE